MSDNQPSSSKPLEATAQVDATGQDTSAESASNPSWRLRQAASIIANRAIRAALKSNNRHLHKSKLHKLRQKKMRLPGEFQPVGHS